MQPAIIIPVYNHEQRIAEVIRQALSLEFPVFVVNDGSTDQMAREVIDRIPKMGKRLHTTPAKKSFSDMYGRAEQYLEEERKLELEKLPASQVVHPDEENRLLLINLKRNCGKGIATARGYKWAKDHDIVCTAVMDGDGQMDPAELESICRPVISENADYVKGNRLRHHSAKAIIPRNRFFGNSVLSILTKIASGYWRVSDTQTAFTAISAEALQSLALDELYPGYGVPNDILVKLNIAYCTLKEVNIKPVYKIGERSKMNPIKVIPPISWLLLKSFFKRLWIKYLFRDFHPLFILYHLSFLLFLITIPYAVKILRLVILGLHANPVTILAFVFLFISGFQSLLFAMWMDMLDNERLYK